MRIRFIKVKGKGWRYVLQVKKWLFWKNIETFYVSEDVERFLNILKEVDDFNKSLNKSDNTIRIPVSITTK